MSPRVILVDDEEASRQTLEALLVPTGCDLTVFDSPLEVLAFLDQNPCPDLLLSDVMMPEMDGFELCHRVRQRSDTATLPIILVTALDRREDVIRGLDSGADEFVSKPVSGPELRARVRTMLRIKGQQDSLREAMGLREDLTRLIVHDMRNPLAAIQIYLQLLLKKYANYEEQQRQDLQAALTEAQSLNEMVNDMLVTARMEHGQLTLARQRMPLGELLRAARQAPFLHGHHDRIEVDLPERDAPALWDGRLLRRVLDNLLTNAVKYTPAGRPIRLHLRYEADRMRLEVRDEGPGIPEEHRATIFEKFAVVPLKEQGVSQTGLGLYFCRLVAEAHGGSIRVEPNQPRGTAFILELPVVNA